MLTRLIAAALLALTLTNGVLAAEHGGEDPLNPISVRGMTFPGDLTVWTAVVFVVVMLILWTTAWKPIAKGLKMREDEIAGQIREAERRNQESRQLLSDYEKKLAASQDEVRAILEKARRDAEQVGREMLDKAKEDAAMERQRAVQQIESATAAALKELAERSATLAVNLAGRIVRTQLKPQDHSRLIQEAVANFAGKGNGKKR